MDLDLIFVAGLLIGAFAIPSLVAAFADRRLPVQGVMMLIVAGVVIAYTIQEDSERYTFANTDDVVVEVLGRYLN